MLSTAIIFSNTKTKFNNQTSKQIPKKLSEIIKQYKYHQYNLHPKYDEFFNYIFIT